ncbi:hypothetical protein [Pseudothauera rhizosphaerae]|uniref:Tetratricopeptide repeat-containing protein n=1 Tax=Pseudothauera rhizosphaerae TaxID=2565932 RepID=A0A4S4AKD8_9RHOO|nr:hypothetical protein [Pseudothauera rhizosphaerae]THF59374.1 hypothetical protein E6O51_15390 [Pseudothauera rhizosphaerae]
MDLLHFDPEPLYFDDPLPEGVLALLEAAGERYGEAEAETLLEQAHAAAPDHLMVLVARYRYFFYRHRLAEADAVVWQAVAVVAARLGLPADGRGLDEERIAAAAQRSMTLTRFYLSALKAAAYVRLRRGETAGAVRLLETLVRVDQADRLGGQALLHIAHNRQSEEAGELAELDH